MFVSFPPLFLRQARLFNISPVVPCAGWVVARRVVVVKPQACTLHYRFAACPDGSVAPYAGRSSTHLNRFCHLFTSLLASFSVSGIHPVPYRFWALYPLVPFYLCWALIVPFLFAPILYQGRNPIHYDLDLALALGVFSFLHALTLFPSGHAVYLLLISSALYPRRLYPRRRFLPYLFLFVRRAFFAAAFLFAFV